MIRRGKSKAYNLGMQRAAGTRTKIFMTRGKPAKFQTVKEKGKGKAKRKREWETRIKKVTGQRSPGRNSKEILEKWKKAGSPRKVCTPGYPYPYDVRNEFASRAGCAPRESNTEFKKWKGLESS